MSARDALLGLYQSEGKLTPEQVVAAAHDPASELHKHFEWEDGVAAHSWRLHQAQHLIGRYRIEIEVEPERIVRVRQFTNVPSRGTYMPTDEAITEHRDEVFHQAVVELSAFREKYEALLNVEQAWTSARRRKRRPLNG